MEINPMTNSTIELDTIKQDLETIGTELKVLYRSASYQDNTESEQSRIFDTPIGNDGDSMAIANIYSKVENLYKSIKDIKVTQNADMSKSLDELYNKASRVNSLVILLKQSELFDYLTDPESEGIHGSLDLLFILINELFLDIDIAICQAIAK